MHYCNSNPNPNPNSNPNQVGMDVRKLVPCGAALLHQTWAGDKRQFPRMVWPANAFKDDLHPNRQPNRHPNPNHDPIPNPNANPNPNPSPNPNLGWGTLCAFGWLGTSNSRSVRM